MNTEPLLEVGKIEKKLEDLAPKEPIKPAQKVARCFECETKLATLINYILIATNERVLLCSPCANKFDYRVSRPRKISKKERNRLKKLNKK